MNLEKLEVGQRGIIISSPLEVNTTMETIEIHNAALDPWDLRRSLLFFDRLAWPTSGFLHQETTDSIALEELGVMVRPSFNAIGTPSERVAASFTQFFDRCEETSPGRWAMATGETSTLIHGNNIESQRGLFAELNSVIPVPTNDIPFEDILEFKTNYSDELAQLRIAIDEFAERIESQEDVNASLASATDEIATHSKKVIKAMKGKSIPFQVSNWKVGYSINPLGIVGAALLVADISGSIGTPIEGAVAAAALSGLSFSSGAGKINGNLKPFSYVGTINTIPI